LNPADENDFKRELLLTRKAEITWIYSDGTQMVEPWNAFKFKATSNVKNNIQGRTPWREKDVNRLVEVRVKIVY
jgi:hypothetical protein